METTETYKKKEILNEGRTIPLVTKNQENGTIERKGLTITLPDPNQGQNQNTNQGQQSNTTRK